MSAHLSDPTSAPAQRPMGAARPAEREAAGGEGPALLAARPAGDPRPFDRVFSAAFDRPTGEGPAPARKGLPERPAASSRRRGSSAGVARGGACQAFGGR